MDNLQMASRVTLKSVNDELARTGIQARLEKASGYFFFSGGESGDWLDRSIRTAKISDLTLDGWMAEFHRLKKINADIMKSGKAKRGAGK